MTDEELLADLQDLAKNHDTESNGRLSADIAEVVRRAEAPKRANLHWRSVSLLTRARDAIAPRRNLDRPLALALGGKVELLLGWADSLGVKPPPALLASLERDLAQAIEVDPTLPDVHWDSAVIAARYRGDWDEARNHLMRAKELGYEHPMLPRLEGMLEARPPLPPEPDAAEVELRRLVLELAGQACGPQESLLHIEEEDAHTPGEGPGVRTFGGYVSEVRGLAKTDDLPVEAQLGVLAGTRAITSDSKEYVLDLLRRFAEFRVERDAPDTRFLDHATNLHLDIVRQMSFAHFDRGRHTGEERELRRALRASDRALRVVDSSPAKVDPDLHADLLLSRGQTLYALDTRNVVETIRCYREALPLKRQAGNKADEKRLVKLFWKQIDSRVAETMVTLHMGGFGEAIEVLTACADAADDLDDPDHALGVRCQLGSVQRSVGLRDDAEGNLRRVIAECKNAETVKEAKFELASVLSESKRPAEAAAIQEELIASAPDGVDPKTANLFSNYSQSLLLLDQLEHARKALEEAWLRLPANEKKKNDNVPELGARIRVLQAEVESRLGNTEAAMDRLEEAAVLYGDHTLGIGGLHYHRIRARVLIAADRTDDALESLDRADHLIRYMLGQRPSYLTWESMLREWSSLDVAAVRNLIATGEPQDAEKAFLRAEAAKGRVTAWLEHAAAPKGAERALDPERQRKALEETRTWLAAEPGRRLVSLFASEDGLAVFDVAPEAGIRGAWIEDFRYGDVLSERYEPWERLVEVGTTGDDEEAEERADAETIILLDQVGGWLVNGAPVLAEGGRRLAIVPHRLFRCLPLLHARLPGGERLSELFDEVVVAPTLDYLARTAGAKAGEPPPPERVAVADSQASDPEGQLPFARCEALLAAGPGKHHLGPDATCDAIRGALLHPGIVLLSVHGDFDEEQPFRSKLFTADGALELRDLVMRGRIESSGVLLGACESGRSRRSLSDEPLSFPTLLLQGGATTVVAPAWPVDDLSSFLFTTRVIDFVDEGVALAPAVPQVARWLRELRPAEVLARLDALVARLDSTGAEGRAARATVEGPLEDQRAWLESLGQEDRPFASTLDWAPFQVFVAGA